MSQNLRRGRPGKMGDDSGVTLVLNAHYDYVGLVAERSAYDGLGWELEADVEFHRAPGAGIGRNPPVDNSLRGARAVGLRL